MQHHAELDFEISAPSALLFEQYADASCWPLDPDAEPGRWRWQGDSWQVRRLHEAPTLRWVATSLTEPERICYLTLQLIDAATSTHARLHVVVDDPGASGRWPWSDRRGRRAVLAVARQLAARFKAAGSPPAPDHPLTRAAFAQMGALEELARIEALDRRWNSYEHGARPKAPHRLAATLPPSDEQYDLVYAGGGLGLLHAALMARRGYRVLLFDRHQVGCAHREWNISHDELERLVATGFIDWATLEHEIIMTRYDDGIVRFFAGGSAVPPAEIRLPNVLNIALDAGALLQYARRAFVAAGGVVREGWAFEEVIAHQDPRQGVVVRVQTPDGERSVAARLLIDGMGATSPLALGAQPFSGICPTVGTVVRGVADHDPRVGDILISIADSQGERQLIWEGFPGRDGELTVYVFYYDQTGDRAQHKHSLLDLYEDYFALLPIYKQPGPDFAHERPVYGYIPGRHSIKRPLPLQGVLAVGDASAQQSPLTFCGFGSFIRNLARTVDGADRLLKHELLAPAQLRLVSAHQANVSMNWVFSRFMAPWGRPQDVNELQNVFARVMNEVGPATAQRFFQDQMTWSDYRSVIMMTLHLYPAIMGVAWRVLGLRDIGHWIADWLRFSRTALVATLGAPVLPALIGLTEGRAPAANAVLRAHWDEWLAMGWINQRWGE